MRKRIALRLFAFFALALLLFALTSGLMFRSLFTNLVRDTKKEEMKSRAALLSDALSQALGGARGGGRFGGQNSYTNFVQLLTLAEPNLWVLDENLSFLSTGRMPGGRTLAYSAIPPEAESLVQAVFEGKTAFSEGFGSLLKAPTLTIGSPIVVDGRVVGALLLNDAISGTSQAAAQGQRILLYSTGAAMLLSILLAWALAYSFTKPIKRMQTTALRLSKGDYEASTGIMRKDEVGELAQSLDLLSLKLKQARDESQRQEQQRQDFLAKISHELRTPVTVLRGSLEALKDGVVSGDKAHEYHEQMLLETGGLERLVNDLMELTRLQSTDFPIEKAPLNLLDVANDALRGAERLARQKDIAMLFEQPEVPVLLVGDYARLRQMLLIVLDNAVKFSGSGSQVKVVLGEKEITVTDQGPGIPEDELSKIFDRFHKTAAGNQQGSGLGLAIARQIALRHHMDIQVTSQLGQGSQVRFSWQ